jgi:hypothetical protein
VYCFHFRNEHNNKGSTEQLPPHGNSKCIRCERQFAVGNQVVTCIMLMVAVPTMQLLPWLPLQAPLPLLPFALLLGLLLVVGLPLLAVLLLLLLLPVVGPAADIVPCTAGAANCTASTTKQTKRRARRHCACCRLRQ